MPAGAQRGVDPEHEALVRQGAVGETLPQLGDDPVPVGIADPYRGRTVRRSASKCPHSQKYRVRVGRAQAEGRTSQRPRPEASRRYGATAAPPARLRLGGGGPEVSPPSTPGSAAGSGRRPGARSRGTAAAAARPRRRSPRPAGSGCGTGSRTAGGSRSAAHR